MALTTYSGLLSSIAGWLMRDDLTSVIPDFVTLAEADMNRRLRLRSMMVRATTTLTGDGYETLPTDFLQMWRLTLDDQEIEFSPTVHMAGYAEAYSGLAPSYFSIIGEQIQFAPVGPVAGGVLEMTYYASIPALSDANPTNAVLTASPSLYLYGSLMQAAPYLLDDARLQTWGMLYTQAAELLGNADDRAEFAGPLVIRTGEILP